MLRVVSDAAVGSAPSSGAVGETTEDAQLASSLRIAVMRLARRLRAERSDGTLGLSQLSALSTLERHGPLSPTALAELERIQPPSMTRVIAALEERRLVGREPHPSDRRQAVIAISDAGRQIVLEDRRRRQAWLARSLDDLGPGERALLEAALPVLERLSEV
jgi:DNA-binding MarR family transcriptional regulator